MNTTQLRQFGILVVISYILALTTIWHKIARIFARRENKQVTSVDCSPRYKIAASLLKSGSLTGSPLNPRKDPDEMALGGTTLLEGSMPKSGNTLSNWLTSPRNPSTLNSIIDATYNNDIEEAIYAFSEMLKVTITLDVLNPDHKRLFHRSLTVVLEWCNSKDDAHASQHGMLLEPLPEFIQSCRSDEDLESFIRPLIEFVERNIDRGGLFRSTALYTVKLLVERKSLPQDILKEAIVPRLYQLTEEWAEVDQPVEMALMLCSIITSGSIVDRSWIYEHFFWRYSNLLNHQMIHVRKAAIPMFGLFAEMFGPRFVELYLIPVLLHLCDDSNWGIRKTIVDVFVAVSAHSPINIRRSVLAPRFIKLLHDSSRWVCFAAYQELGPFIATFANPLVTGLRICNGKITSCDKEIVADTAQQKAASANFGIPPNAWLPPSIEQQRSHEELETKNDNDIKTALKNLFEIFHSPRGSNVIRDWEKLLVDENRTTSLDSLSNTETDDDGSVSMDLDETLCEDSEEIDVDIDESSQPEPLISKFIFTDSPTTPHPMAADIDRFSQLAYWSTGYDAISVDTDELVAFGSSETPATATSFLEKRFDALYVSSENSKSPSKVSPGRPCSSSRSSTGSPYVRSNAPVETMDIDDIFPDCRDVGDAEEDAEMDDDLDSSEDYVVPAELVESFMAVVTQNSLMDSDVHRCCAYNFPAVMYTLGKDGWSALKGVYLRLAHDEQVRVRISIASSMHEIAAIIGSKSTDEDLLPLFNIMREDISDVRQSILKHLFDFYKCLTPDARRAMLDILPQFMPVDNMMQSNWRFRLEFAKQCRKLCTIYGVEEINRTMSAIALTLADDRVADVRKEAIQLVSHIIRRLLVHEWKSDNECSDDAIKAPLTELFVQDIVTGFAKSQKWTRRQTFAHICEQILLEGSMTIDQFRYFMLAHLAAMASDRVPNVRISVGRAFALIDSSVQPIPLSCEATHPVSVILGRLLADDDMDVSRQARAASGNINDPEVIDVSDRQRRINLAENDLMMRFHNNSLDNTNYSCDMSLSSEA